jgi:hypothetical protein
MVEIVAEVGAVAAAAAVVWVEAKREVEWEVSQAAD